MKSTSSPISIPWLRHGAMGGAALSAVLLLAVFYTVVAGAVDRAASRRTEAADHASTVATLSAPGGRPIRLARLGY